MVETLDSGEPGRCLSDLSSSAIASSVFQTPPGVRCGSVSQELRMLLKVLVVLLLFAFVIAGSPLLLIVSVCLVVATYSFYQSVLAFRAS